jgi:endonuclease/exonuclease/phosphatase (EEP) superfamily protein YafD
VPFYRASPSPILSCAKPQVIQVVLANVSSENPKAAELVQQLAALNKDIIALFETTEKDVNGVEKDYPYKIFAHQVEGFGIGILSKLPFAGEPVLSMGDELRSVAMVRPTLVSGRSFLLSAFDALPPFDNDALYLNWLLTRRMSILLRHEAQTALVLTDLNATPFSNYYRGLLKDARLSDVMWGRGLERTWDMQSSLIRFALDHALVKGEMGVKEARHLELLGSDHRGLEVALELCGDAASL